MPGIHSFDRGHMKIAWKLMILVVPLGMLLSACQHNGGSDIIPPVSSIKWAWASGSNTVDQAGTYGTLGTADPSNVPGAREQAVTWADPAGLLWLFGGNAFDSSGYVGLINDLWTYDPAALAWTWVSGSRFRGQAGNYGTKGVAALSNVPGARKGAVSWIGADGKLWLFGGLGYDEADAFGHLNDLWNYDPATHEWTWISGSDAGDQLGVYGTLGEADPSNVPGARMGALTWLDPQGVFWLFGGYGFDSAGDKGWLNDLWIFDPTTVEWTWVSGSDTEGQMGVYGTLGTADPLNVPGGRYSAVSWIDLQGQLWLFGGEGLDSEGTRGRINDLWMFDTTTVEWTWVSGNALVGEKGTYGTQGTAAPDNVPGARYTAVPHLDSNGKLWLFGGYGLDADGKSGWLNDLWKFDPATDEWTWESGSGFHGQPGAYGTQGTADSANVPGARYLPVSWTDPQGKLWLFGGYGLDSEGHGGRLNDLWH